MRGPQHGGERWAAARSKRGHEVGQASATGPGRVELAEPGQAKCRQCRSFQATEGGQEGHEGAVHRI